MLGENFVKMALPDMFHGAVGLPQVTDRAGDGDGGAKVADKAEAAERHAREIAQLVDAATCRLAPIRSEFERFSASFSREIAKFSAVHAKIEADHVQLGKRFAALSAEHLQTSEALAASQSQADALQEEQSRLKGENATLGGRLDAATTELHAARDKVAFLQSRNEALEADNARLVAESDQREVANLEIRHELSELSQSYEAARTQIEQGRQRESQIEARNMHLEAEAKDLQARLDEAARQATLDREKIGKLVAVMESAREELESRKRAIAELQEERETLFSAQNSLTIKLDQSRQSVEAKIEALGKAKATLLETVEKQRKQIEEQVSRILRLEEANAKLTQDVLEATRRAEAPGDEPPALAVLPRLSLRLKDSAPPSDFAGTTMVTPVPPMGATEPAMPKREDHGLHRG